MLSVAAQLRNRKKHSLTPKPELVQRMIERALQGGAPCNWFAADEVYGNDGKLCQWLEERR